MAAGSVGRKVALASFIAGAVVAWVGRHGVVAWNYIAHLPEASTASKALPLAFEPASSAEVKEGKPNFQSALYSTSPDGHVQSGIFSAEGPSTFVWRYGVDEAIYIHDGEVQLDYQGQKFTARAGDTVFFHAGTEATWVVPKYVHKSWTIYQPHRFVRWWRKIGS